MNDAEFKQDRLTLEVLEAVERQSDISQRNLARQMGVALGLANSYLKRCVRKGFVKISQAPANRYLYYLTPTGFTEKSRLTAEYLSVSLSFYRQAGASCNRVFNQCDAMQVRQVVLCGVSELAEIAMLRAQEHNIEICAVYDPRQSKKKFFSKPVIQKLKFDQYKHCMFMVTNLAAPYETYAQLCGWFSERRVLAPDILRMDVSTH